MEYLRRRSRLIAQRHFKTDDVAGLAFDDFQMSVETLGKRLHKAGAGSGALRSFVQKLDWLPYPVVFDLNDKPVARCPPAPNADNPGFAQWMGILDRIYQRLAGNCTYGNGLFGRNQRFDIEKKQRLYALGGRK